MGAHPYKPMTGPARIYSKNHGHHKMELKNWNRFINVIAKLRSPKGGCPWDLEQTHETLRPYLLEEAHEVLEAIDDGDVQHLREELGDLLLQVVLHAQVAQDNGDFTIEDVARDIGDKMVRRHPHVFGEKKVKNSRDVLRNWDKIKASEKKKKSASLLDNIPRGLPSLFEALELSKKAAKMGFEWKKPKDVFDKLDEEIDEIKTALKKKNWKNLEEELGDLLFTAANLCRVYHVNPEVALLKANRKFKSRFQKMIGYWQKKQIPLQSVSFQEWDYAWEKIKTEK